MKRKYIDALITLTIGLFLTIISALIINKISSKNLPTEAEAVERYSKQWEVCGTNPEIKIDIARKYFLFSCPEKGGNSSQG